MLNIRHIFPNSPNEELPWACQLFPGLPPKSSSTAIPSASTQAWGSYSTASSPCTESPHPKGSWVLLLGQTVMERQSSVSTLVFGRHYWLTSFSRANNQPSCITHTPSWAQKFLQHRRSLLSRQKHNLPSQQSREHAKPRTALYQPTRSQQGSLKNIWSAAAHPPASTNLLICKFRWPLLILHAHLPYIHSHPHWSLSLHHSGSQCHWPGEASPPPVQAFLGKTALLGLLSLRPVFADPCSRLSSSLGCASICLPSIKAFAVSVYENLSHCKRRAPHSTFFARAAGDGGTVVSSLIPCMSSHQYFISSCWGAMWTAPSVRGSHDPLAVKFTWHLLHPYSSPRWMMPYDKSKYCFNVF